VAHDRVAGGQPGLFLGQVLPLRKLKPPRKPSATTPTHATNPLDGTPQISTVDSTTRGNELSETPVAHSSPHLQAVWKPRCWQVTTYDMLWGKSPLAWARHETRQQRADGPLGTGKASD
jgi:hypothetical protein